MDGIISVQFIFSRCHRSEDDTDAQKVFHWCNRDSTHCSSVLEYWRTIRNNLNASGNTPVVSPYPRIHRDERHLAIPWRVSRICEKRCTKWAFLFPRLLGNETMQAQECCRKGEAYRRLSLFCWHCSIFGSSDILEYRGQLNSRSQCKTVRSTADLCTDKGTKAIPLLSLPPPQKRKKKDEL